MSPIWSAISLCLLPNIGGFVGATIGQQNFDWYDTLKKPRWTPPNALFGPIWTILYTGIGFASYLVLGSDSVEVNNLALVLYLVQLLLNWAWTPIFFGAHNVRMALYDMLLLWVLAAACGFTFYAENTVAGLIFIPYMAWLSTATALTYYILVNNPTPEPTKEK